MAIEINNSNSPIQLNNSVKRKESQSERKFIPKPYIEVAEGMEREFAKIMMDQMNKTIGEKDTPSAGMDYYKNLVNDKRVESMIKKNEGLGLQKMILDQIYPKRMRNEFAFNQYQQQVENKRVNKGHGVELHAPKDGITIHQEGENE